MTTTDQGHPVKACTSCGVVQPITAFHKGGADKYGRRSHCISCAKARRAANPEPQREAKRRHRERQRRARELADVIATVVAPDLEGAACQGRWELFDPPEPDEDEDERDFRIATAKRECLTACPVLDTCRSWADSLPRTKKPVGVIAGRLNNPK